MKKNLKRMMSVFSVFLLAALLLTGCAPIVDDSGAAYIEVEKGFQWKNIYQIGEKLSLDGLTLKYYPDVEKNDFETIPLTEDMISGFDSSKEGSFELTVTYKGKTDTVAYTVVPKATPFEIVNSFCIAENTVVSVDSKSMKATVLVFDSYFKAVENQPSKTEEKALSYLVDGNGKTCASFEYSGSRYDIFCDSESGAYTLHIVVLSSDSLGSTEHSVTPVSLDALQVPQKNVVYKSELIEDTYYSITVDESYNAVVTKHTVNGDTTVDTVVDSYAASDAVLTVNGLLRYSQRKDGHYATATLSPQGTIKVRKEADGALESIYSALCSPVA